MRREAILLLRPPRVAMGDAHRRAEAMSQVLGAPLSLVLLTRPLVPRANVLFPHASLQQNLASLHDGALEADALARWTSWRARAGREPLEVLAAPFELDALTQLLDEAAPALLVVPAALAGFAPGLAAHARRPVLVAHRAAPQDALVVASSFEEPTLPVIREAWRLAQRLESGFTVVHNAAAALPDEPALRSACDAAGLPSFVTVTHRLDAASGIMEAAVVHRADVIVVGVRAGQTKAGVAGRVCATATQSVLVVPF